MSAAIGVPAARPARLGQRWRYAGALPVLTTLIAILLAVPVVVVLANVLAPGQGTWAHLAATVLPEYVANTLWLLVAGLREGAMFATCY